MAEFIEFLSGGISGGAVLLVVVLIFANLTFAFFNKSKLISSEGYYKKLFSINIIVIVFYGFIWIAKKPPQPADRLILLPTTSSNASFVLNEAALLLSDLFEKNNYNLNGRYLTHKWQWLYKTLGKQNTSRYEEWKKLALKLDPYILVESTITENGDYLLTAKLNSSEKIIKHTLRRESLENDLSGFLDKLDLKLKNNAALTFTDEKYLKTDLLLEKGAFDLVYKLLENDSSEIAKIRLAKLYVNRGLNFKYDYEKIKYIDVVNPDFEKAKKILYTIIKSREDSPEVAFLLGRMAIREQEYESAEIFLKRAFIDEPRNARVYYLLSHLLPSRLEELEFKNRKSVLLKAIELDPGYSDPVLDLANLFYITGNGHEKGMGTTGAMQTLESFLTLNADDPKILGLLATLYIKTSKFEKAKQIYQKLAEEYPEDSNVVYNLGVVSYSQTNYENALALFEQAIKMDGNLDAYLYAGITSEMLGRREGALKFYQDRVRLKKTGDDPYAKEAMLGIRKIRKEMALENTGALKQ